MNLIFVSAFSSLFIVRCVALFNYNNSVQQIPNDEVSDTTEVK